MFAIVEIAGKQFKVSQGDKMHLPKLDAKEGDLVKADHVLLVSDGTKTEIGTPYLTKNVEFKINAFGKDDKIRVYKKKAKKRYEKTQGHRQEHTKVEVASIK